MKKIALVGNPNSGKSTVFNHLTGLNNKVGNFPGVTVEKQTGIFALPNDETAEILDLPGLYSLYPNTEDERIALEVLLDQQNPDFPDAVMYVASATQLDRQLLLLTQIIDFGFPTILVINMIDEAKEKNISIDFTRLSTQLGIPVLGVSARTGENMEQIASLLYQIPVQKLAAPFRYLSENDLSIVEIMKPVMGIENPYRTSLIAHHFEKLTFLSAEKKQEIDEALKQTPLKKLDLQVKEIMGRYDKLGLIFQSAVTQKREKNALSQKIDRWLTHPWIGILIYLAIMLLVFQSLYSWASYPMDWIDQGIGACSDLLKNVMPDVWYTHLLTDGVLAGFAGILVFVPQIVLLFLFISLLEEVGYMARVAFLFDGLLRRFGLNGRSLVGLISGGACAIPAIMSTRTINNSKERLITILVIPFISCSARIPVYTILVGFVVPSVTVWGFLNAQGLVFMGLFFLGIFAALGTALILKFFIKAKEESFLMLELPPYRIPHWRNVMMNLKNQLGAFIFNAGKIILFISIFLWFLVSFGPGDSMELAEIKARNEAQISQLDSKNTENAIAAARIEASYAGIMGKKIEPLISPMGFDWRIGIALITSFAAREVFVSTMSTLYSSGNQDEDTETLRQRMASQKDANGIPFFTWPRALSLVVFYVLALQCMSTLAVVKRETNSWKWPILQFFYMGAMAYLLSWFIYAIWG
jgi:ferrous iron transport protein B